MLRKWQFLFFLITLLILRCLPRVKPVQFPAEPEVKVALLTGQARVGISATAPFTVYAGNEKRTIPSGAICRISHYNTVTVQGAIWLKKANFPIQIKSESTGLITIGNRRYRGYLEVRKDQAGQLTIINVLPLEKYLFGVVPCEIGRVKDKTFEAVKAQAIAARSYTVSHFGWFEHQGFDVFATYLRDQEYRGAGFETEMTTKAVLATYGIVAVHRNQAIEAKYHSTCGGFTVGTKAPYLRAHPDTPGHRKGKKPFCSKSPHFLWRKKLSHAELVAVLTKILPDIKPQPKIKSIKLETDRHSQRNRFVQVRIGRARYKIKSEVLRQALDLKTNFYSVKLTRRSINFIGHGYGHGIGLCQFGALEMSRRGYSCEQIINHYYPGTKLKRIY